MCNMRHDLGDWQGMVDAARRQLAVDTKYIDAYADLVHSLWHAHRSAEALAVADRGLALAPGDSGLLNWRADMLADTGRAQDAIDAANLSIATARSASDNKGIASGYLSRAGAYLKLGKPELAMADFEQAISAGRARTDLSFDYGYTLIALGRVQEALGEFEGKVRESPRVWDGHAGVARAYAALGRHEEAVQRFELTARGDPDDPTLYRDWAKSLDALGRKQEAAARRVNAERAESRLKLPLPLS
jgi:tetratricopeptide (TPR) repeat protein